MMTGGNGTSGSGPFAGIDSQKFSSQLQQVSRTREHFPETWIWETIYAEYDSQFSLQISARL